jgi:LmbE family N-acetylglucosaminyl deacetylase
MAISRRNFVVSAAVPFLAAPRLKVVVTGGHPGDPECGCGGTIARYADLGHEVVLLYMNRGEGFCKGAEPARCGAVRSEEARQACEILKARAAFAGQIDGQSIVDNAHYDAFQLLLAAERPDIVFAQWPLDRHRDHRALSQLVLDAWLHNGRKWALYYYEVAEDTMMFAPADYVDISASGTQERRRAACYAHASQEPDKWYPAQVQLTRFRGTQGGHAQAEAFLRHWESKSALLP